MEVRRQLALGLVDAHPAEAAAVLEALPADEAAAFLARLAPEPAARLLRHVTAQPAAAMLARLPEPAAAELVQQLPVDVAAPYLRRLPEARREAILSGLSGRRTRALRALLRHREGTAGALMDPDVLALPEDLTVREALERVRSAAEQARYNLYVVDREDRLVGVLNLRELLMARPRERLGTIGRREVIRLAADTDARAIADHPGWQRAHALPVVDARGTYLGALRYRTLRRLEAERAPAADGGDVTAHALGELFWTGVSGVMDALAGAPGEPRGAPPARSGGSGRGRG